MKEKKGNMVLKPAERGESREEYFAPGRVEPFGLHKRSRRLRKGIATTNPQGKYDSKVLERYGIRS